MLDGEPGVAQNSTEGAESYFVVQRNGDRELGADCGVPEANMASSLPDNLIADPCEDPDQFLARDDG